MVSEEDIRAQRRRNRLLRWVPRLKVTGGVRLRLTRRLLHAATIGSAARVRRRGIALTQSRLPTPDRTPVRILRPDGPPRGVLIDFHGGAWAVGLAAMDDKLNAGFAAACGLLVFSVDYRLAMPRSIAAIQAECAAAALAIAERPDAAHLPIFLTGESAGGHLALSTALRLKDRPEWQSRFRGMVLHYGVYDLGGTPSAMTAGKDSLVLHGPSLERQVARLCPGLTQEERRRPDLSPLYGDLTGLPPALIVVGDIDPLRDDSVQLAERLQAAKVEAELALLPEAPHGIIHFPGAYAAKVRERGHRWLRQRLAAIPA